MLLGGRWAAPKPSQSLRERLSAYRHELKLRQAHIAVRDGFEPRDTGRSWTVSRRSTPQRWTVAEAEGHSPGSYAWRVGPLRVPIISRSLRGLPGLVSEWLRMRLRCPLVFEGYAGEETCPKNERTKAISPHGAA